jgi:hypothetical protein
MEKVMTYINDNNLIAKTRQTIEAIYYTVTMRGLRESIVAVEKQ